MNFKDKFGPYLFESVKGTLERKKYLSDQNLYDFLINENFPALFSNPFSKEKTALDIAVQNSDADVVTLLRLAALSEENWC